VSRNVRPIAPSHNRFAPELRAKVERLLDAHPKAARFMEEPAVQLDPTVGQTIPQIAERPGSTIGPYKLPQELGHGGIGIVFMAQQSEPVQRRVALKIIPRADGGALFAFAGSWSFRFAKTLLRLVLDRR
jgi:hypothetical protein